MAVNQNKPEEETPPRKEWALFIFIVVFLFPMLSVMVVGGFGFMVWMFQLIMGPPGPPSIH